MERVAAETPPVLISPAKASTKTKPKVARALEIGSSENPKQEKQAPGSTGSSSVSTIVLSYLSMVVIVIVIAVVIAS